MAWLCRLCCCSSYFCGHVWLVLFIHGSTQKEKAGAPGDQLRGKAWPGLLS